MTKEDPERVLAYEMATALELLSAGGLSNLVVGGAAVPAGLIRMRSLLERHDDLEMTFARHSMVPNAIRVPGT